jgi:hypothetical protein
MANRYAPIGEYGIIGDLHTVALASMDGSIDFLCFPSFDSPSVFAALLDADRGGRFQIAPVLDGAARKQLYLPDTNVLLTRFLDTDDVGSPGLHARGGRRSRAQPGTACEDGALERGRLQDRCARFVYSQATTELRGARVFVGRAAGARRRPGSRRRCPCGSGTVRRSRVPARRRSPRGSSSGGRCPLPADRDPDYYRDAFKATVNFWRRWIDRNPYRGRWREQVNRSALTLKLLTSQEHGSIVAAPTFGLPENIGGVRNWDYRYTWIRDSSFTLYGLMRLGYTWAAAFAWVMQPRA